MCWGNENQSHLAECTKTHWKESLSLIDEKLLSVTQLLLESHKLGDLISSDALLFKSGGWTGWRLPMKSFKESWNLCSAGNILNVGRVSFASSSHFVMLCSVPCVPVTLELGTIPRADFFFPSHNFLKSCFVVWSRDMLGHGYSTLKYFHSFGHAKLSQVLWEDPWKDKACKPLPQEVYNLCGGDPT